MLCVCERLGTGSEQSATLPLCAHLLQVITLCGATVSTFMTSVLVGGRMNPVHVQNASLAGAVAMGAACSLPVRACLPCPSCACA